MWKLYRIVYSIVYRLLLLWRNLLFYYISILSEAEWTIADKGSRIEGRKKWEQDSNKKERRQPDRKEENEENKKRRKTKTGRKTEKKEVKAERRHRNRKMKTHSHTHDS